MHVYTHTLQVRPTSTAVRVVSYRPAVGTLPTTWVAEVAVAPRSTATLTVRYASRLLRLHEHGMEPHRGVDVPSSLVCVRRASVDTSSVHSPGGTCGRSEADREAGREGGREARGLCSSVGVGEYVGVLFTAPLVVALPLADFSMPYNAIMIVSAAMAVWIIALTNTHTTAERDGAPEPGVQPRTAERDAVGQACSDRTDSALDRTVHPLEQMVLSPQADKPSPELLKRNERSKKED